MNTIKAFPILIGLLLAAGCIKAQTTEYTIDGMTFGMPEADTPSMHQ